MPHFDVPALYRGRLVVTIHDLIHVRFPQYSTRPFSRAYAGWQIRRAVRRAAAIITVSEHTREDLERFIPGSSRKTTVLYPGVGPAFKPLDGSVIKPVLDRNGIERGYFLYVGNIRGTKNTLRLIAAYQKLKEADRGIPPLVLVGHNTYPQFEKGFPDGIKHLGSVPFEDLPALYNGASMFVFPSIYEGFGLPPLEAMACGTPVISSNASSLPEVCGEAAVYVNPYSEQSIADAMRDLHQSPSRKTDLSRRGLARAKKFDWDSFARGTWNVYERAMA
jgi:glycosyltransferase involved in cell wall biosynthesis